MPARPETPGFIEKLRDFERRLTDTERQVLFPDDEDTDLQVYENGNLLGPVDFLDFGNSLQASLIGDRYVRVDGVASELELDAIVDGTLAVSDPDSRYFLGIGEALTYLANVVGLTSCIVGVRPWSNPGAAIGYEETADWTMPLQTRLFGMRGASPPVQAVAEGNGFAWTIGNFKGRTPAAAIPDLRIENCITLQIRQTTADLRFGTVWMYDTYVDRTTSGGYFCGSFYGVGCTFDFVAGDPRLAQFRAQIQISDLGRIGTGILAGTALEMIGCVWGGGVITLPAFFHIDCYVSVSFRAPSFPAPPSLVVPNNGFGYINIPSSAGATVTATNNFGPLVLEGGFNTLTLTGSHLSLRINADGAGGGLWNISGPADIHATASGAGRFQLRGEGISGSIAADNLTGSTTLLDFIGCDRSNLSIAADPTGSTRKSYAFDASSDRNVLVFHGLDSGWTAGTDAGTNNRVLPEGTTPFSGVSGHVIEDEGTPLTQRANLNFVGAGVTVTDSAPDTIVTIPGGGSSAPEFANILTFFGG